uniref:Uncharacterized protein n=1 Tax=Candidatus Methanogaster sp. ANME-2c ERB4 TaxID=2759911 RepID=A0A7G9Y9N2_9EURY|nr:hypothetical protein FHHLOMNB_00002 [Methanosarcinales archaeon ANME-2c ERB4]
MPGNRARIARATDAPAFSISWSGSRPRSPQLASILRISDAVISVFISSYLFTVIGSTPSSSSRNAMSIGSPVSGLISTGAPSEIWSARAPMMRARSYRVYCSNVVASSCFFCNAPPCWRRHRWIALGDPLWFIWDKYLRTLSYISERACRIMRVSTNVACLSRLTSAAANVAASHETHNSTSVRNKSEAVFSMHFSSHLVSQAGSAAIAV